MTPEGSQKKVSTHGLQGYVRKQEICNQTFHKEFNHFSSKMKEVVYCKECKDSLLTLTLSLWRLLSYRNQSIHLLHSFTHLQVESTLFLRSYCRINKILKSLIKTLFLVDIKIQSVTFPVYFVSLF